MNAERAVYEVGREAPKPDELFQVPVAEWTPDELERLTKYRRYLRHRFGPVPELCRKQAGT